MDYAIPSHSTLLDLVQLLLDKGEPEPEEKALELLQSKRVTLTGNLKGYDWSLEK